MPRVLLTFLSCAFLISSPALAQNIDPLVQIPVIFNTLLFLIGGFLVMFMAAGFAMLEAGLVRSASVGTILTKNIALYSIAGLMFWVLGYNLMYLDVSESGGWFGTIMPWSADDSSIVETGYTAASDWFFQMVFVATAASVVSGTIAERVKLWPFLIFVALLTGVIYPIVGAWKWGGGWLDAIGFMDFAGSTIVHSTGGWAALTGAIIIGARHGRFDKQGRPKLMPGSSLPLATIGTFILWLGWFGFNGGSQLALGTLDDAVAVSTIFVNTNMAAAAGVITAMLATQLLYKKVDATMALNGALAGLVSITAEPLTPSIGMAVMIGAIGAIIVVITVPLLNKFRIDDVVGAIPVHLCCGIWGTLAVPLTNSDSTFQAQLIGISSVAIFVLISSTLIWHALKATVGVNLTPEEQVQGSDWVELGMDAYPEFVTRTR